MEPIYTEIGLSNASFDMVFIEGGNFVMGEDNYWDTPTNEVALDDFYIGKYPVIQALWKAIMGDENNPSFFKGDQRPVEKVSWHQTQEFIQRLNQQTDKTYRLPSEAEWEYAARGGQQSQGFIYAGSNKLWEVGWYRARSYMETKVVGQKRPNELGLYEMSGNVWNWCLDWYSDEYWQDCSKVGIIENPQGPDRGEFRVIRGGSWGSDPAFCRSAYRSLNEPDKRESYFGFRLVFSL